MKRYAYIVMAVLVTSGIWVVVCATAFNFGMYIGADECRGD